MFWGLTPSMNFLEETKLNKNEINILIVGGCDARHILKTLSKSYKRDKQKMNFFLMELVPEIIAKELLLLYVAFQSVEELGILQKTRRFMEIFGNTLTRPSTAKYISETAQELIQMITNHEELDKKMPNITLNLKYKERDYIENLYKFWSCTDNFNIVDCWDRRLRKSLGVRYDTKRAAFDWDLHMRLHSIGGHFINNQEYQSFRGNGVSFSWLETEVTKPNRSMVTGIAPNGEHFGHYGYLGDIQTGPFISYGIECDDSEYTKKSNMVYKYRATDITERNLREIFHELEFGEEYHHHSTSNITLGSTTMQVADLKVVDISGDTEIVRETKRRAMIPLADDVTINFISINRLEMMKHKAKYKDFFDVVYIAHNAVKYVCSDVIRHIASESCVLILENPLFVIGNRDKELKAHYETIRDRLQDLDKYEYPFDVSKDFYLKFILKS